MSIGERETAGELHARMQIEGAQLLVTTLNHLSENNVEEKEQMTTTEEDSAILKHAPKITADTCKIDWSQNAGDIVNLIRGLSPYPGAFTFLKNKKLKIFQASKVTNVPTNAKGEFSTDQKTYLHFGSADGNVSVTDLQLEGKNRMTISDFLRGWRP